MRPRQLSVSSSYTSSSCSDDSFSSSSSTSSVPLEAEEIKHIFRTRRNIITSTSTDEDVTYQITPTAIQLSFSAIPSIDADFAKTWQQRKPGKLLVDDALNPSAVPFVPKNTHKKGDSDRQIPYASSADEDKTPTTFSLSSNHTSLANHPPPGLGPFAQNQSPQQGLPSGEVAGHPVWMAAFNAGVDAVDHHSAMHFAHNTVFSLSHWGDDDLASLALQISWYAYTDAENTGSDALALFAQCLFQIFSAQISELVGQTFLLHLRRHTLRAFDMAWDPLSLDQKAYTASQVALHVEGGISLSRFISDLFSYGMLSSTHVMSCVNQLLVRPDSQEHIVAIGYFIIRSGVDLWGVSDEDVPHNISGWKKEFFARAGVAQHTAISLLGREPGYSKGWVDTIGLQLAEWEACFVDA